MTKLLTFDVGGTSIKYAVFKDGELSEQGSRPTPDNLDDYFALLKTVQNELSENHEFAGVALSNPGAVNKATGYIEGASALPYIHGFDIFSAYQELFQLPISVENDANAAALAEMKYGNGRGLKDILFIVLGTGVGGAVIVDGKIHHGKHLYGGEFGFMQMSGGDSLSMLGSAVHMAERYNKRANTELDAVEVFNRYFAGDDIIANEEAETFFGTIAEAVFNLQHSFDPEKIIFGGGVSKADFLVDEIQKRLDQIAAKMTINTLTADMTTCLFHNDANLIGSAVAFEQVHG